MPPVGPLGLPLELLYKISEDVAMSTNDILNPRCVNKTFNGLTTPLAFREIVVHGTEKSAQGLLDLLLSKKPFQVCEDHTNLRGSG